jgi:hypothetical protein
VEEGMLFLAAYLSFLHCHRPWKLLTREEFHPGSLYPRPHARIIAYAEFSICSIAVPPTVFDLF